MNAKKPGARNRVAAGRRVLDARAFLSRATGASIQELMSEHEVSRRTAIRYLEALRDAGEKLEVIGERGRSKVHRLVLDAKTPVGTFTSQELVGQKLLEGYASGLEGTGLDEAIRRASAKMSATLKPKDRARMLDTARKFLHIPGHLHDYSDKAEIVDEIISALLAEQRIMLKHENKKRERKRFKIDPLTLVTFNGALYVLGFSHYHNAIRTFAVDRIEDATWLRHDGFVYPTDFNPRKVFEGAFGMMTGEETEVVIRFDASAWASLRRRRWHATQLLESKRGFLYLTIRPRGTNEVLSWVLGWGAKAAIVSPPSLRNEWRKEAEEMLRAARELEAADERSLGKDDEEEAT